MGHSITPYIFKHTNTNLLNEAHQESMKSHNSTHTDMCSHSHIHGVNVTEGHNLFFPLSITEEALYWAYFPNQLPEADILKGTGKNNLHMPIN